MPKKPEARTGPHAQAAKKAHAKGEATPRPRKAAGKRAGVVPLGAVTLAGAPLVYLNVPKSACTTIKNLMYFMDHGRFIDEPLDIHSHDGLLRSRERTAETQQLFDQRLRGRHLVFTFVRHPGKRAYSCFIEKIFNQSKYSFPKIRDYIAEHYDLRLPAPGAGYDLAMHRANFMAFLDFVRDNFAERTSVRVDAHWGRQSAILDHFQKYFYIDFIGRVEQFEPNFAHVASQFPLPHMPDLGTRFNEGPKPPYPYEAVADEAVEARLRRIYQRDYERLGYAD